MRNVRLIATALLGAALSGCSAEPLVCTADFAFLTATVVNGADQPITSPAVTDTILRTGAVLHVTAGSPAQTVPAHGAGSVTIFSDAFLNAVEPAGDDVSVVVATGSRAASARYRFGSDGCHVRKLAGPDTLVVP